MNVPFVDQNITARGDFSGTEGQGRQDHEWCGFFLESRKVVKWF